MNTKDRIDALRVKAKELEEEARSLETRLEAERAEEEAHAKLRVFYWENPENKQQFLEVLTGTGWSAGKIVFVAQAADYEGGPVPLPPLEVERLIAALVLACEMSKLSTDTSSTDVTALVT